MHFKKLISILVAVVLLTSCSSATKNESSGFGESVSDRKPTVIKSEELANVGEEALPVLNPEDYYVDFVETTEDGLILFKETYI